MVVHLPLDSRYHYSSIKECLSAVPRAMSAQTQHAAQKTLGVNLSVAGRTSSPALSAGELAEQFDLDELEMDPSERRPGGPVADAVQCLQRSALMKKWVDFRSSVFAAK